MKQQYQVRILCMINDKLRKTFEGSKVFHELEMGLKSSKKKSGLDMTHPVFCY